MNGKYRLEISVRGHSHSCYGDLRYPRVLSQIQLVHPSGNREIIPIEGDLKNRLQEAGFLKDATEYNRIEQRPHPTDEIVATDIEENSALEMFLLNSIEEIYSLDTFACDEKVDISQPTAINPNPANYADYTFYLRSCRGRVMNA